MNDVPSDNIQDLSDLLIIPGFVDAHVHAPQYVFTGTGYHDINALLTPQFIRYLNALDHQAWIYRYFNGWTNTLFLVNQDLKMTNLPGQLI